MRKLILSLMVAALAASPVHAADWQGQTTDVRPGTFIGARLTIGGNTGRRASAALTIAPTQNRLSHNGVASMRIGEGIALKLSRGAKPTLTLAGVRADTVLGLRRVGDPDADMKLGLSDGGTIALGLGIAALIGGGLYLAADHIADCDEGECD